MTGGARPDAPVGLRQTLRSPATTVSAVAVLSGITPAVTHELVGHGVACLTAGGRPTVVSTSMFWCTEPEPVVAAGGPAVNLLVGLACLLLLRLAAPASASLRLYLVLVTAFAWFWEGGYAVQAMLVRGGDLYDLLAATTGPPTALERLLVAGAGGSLYLLTIRLTRSAIAEIAGDRARWVSRVAWTGATLAVTLAASTSTLGSANLRNTVMAIGVAGLPLLVAPPPSPRSSTAVAPFAGSTALALATLTAFLVFAATLGRGLVWA